MIQQKNKSNGTQENNCHIEPVVIIQEGENTQSSGTPQERINTMRGLLLSLLTEQFPRVPMPTGQQPDSRHNETDNIGANGKTINDLKANATVNSQGPKTGYTERETWTQRSRECTNTGAQDSTVRTQTQRD